MALPRRPIKPVQPSASKPAAKPSLPKRTLPGRPAAPVQNYGEDDPFAKARKLKQEKDREAEARKNRPHDFRMKAGEGGENGVEVLLLDTVRLPNMPFFHYMHRWGYQQNVPGSGKSEVCIQDGPQGCPLCEKLGKQGNWEMVLSCIDNRAYTPNSGPNAGKTVARSKKTITTKTKMTPKFERLYKEHKTFRGMIIRLFRDNAKDESIGSEVQFVRFLTEAQLAKYGDMGKPFDYNKAYPRPSYEELEERYKGESAGGGKSRSTGSADFADGDDDIPF